MSGSANSPGLIDSLRTIFKLYITDAKLTVSAKLSHVLGWVAILFAGALLGLGALLFLSIALAMFLSHFMGLMYASLTVAGIYLLMIVIIFLFRRTLVDDPITRMVTGLMLDPPSEHTSSVSIVKDNSDEEN